MISIEECKKYIGETNLSDKEIEKIRELLYAFVERSLDYIVEKGMLLDEENPC